MKTSLKRDVEGESKKGKKEKDENVGPGLPPGFVPSVAAKQTSSSEASSSEDSSSDDSSDEDESKMTLPISSEITLNHGTKPLGAMALDPSGARLLTGGND